PNAVRIEAKAIAGERGRKRAIAFELVFRWEYTTLQLVRTEAVEMLQSLCMFDELLYGPNLSRLVWITEKQVRRERYTLAQTSTEHLRTIVVKRRCRVRDQKPQLFQPGRIVSDQVTPECLKLSFRRLATTTHL